MSEVLCICPKCKVEHMVEMVWIGGCTPRKYCPEHKKLGCKSEECVYDFTFNAHGRTYKKVADQGDILQG